MTCNTTITKVMRLVVRWCGKSASLHPPYPPRWWWCSAPPHHPALPGGRRGGARCRGNLPSTRARAQAAAVRKLQRQARREATPIPTEGDDHEQRHRPPATRYPDPAGSAARRRHAHRHLRASRLARRWCPRSARNIPRDGTSGGSTGLRICHQRLDGVVLKGRRRVGQEARAQSAMVRPAASCRTRFRVAHHGD